MTLKKSLNGIGIFHTVMEIDPGEVIYCKADGSYTDICLRTGRVCKISHNLKSVSGVLPANRFLRCHRSYLVNKHAITGFDILGRKLVLDERFTVPVSRRRLESAACRRKV